MSCEGCPLFGNCPVNRIGEVMLADEIIAVELKPNVQPVIADFEALHLVNSPSPDSPLAQRCNETLAENILAESFIQDSIFRQLSGFQRQNASVLEPTKDMSVITLLQNKPPVSDEAAKPSRNLNTAIGANPIDLNVVLRKQDQLAEAVGIELLNRKTAALVEIKDNGPLKIAKEPIAHLEDVAASTSVSIELIDTAIAQPIIIAEVGSEHLSQDESRDQDNSAAGLGVEEGLPLIIAKEDIGNAEYEYRRKVVDKHDLATADSTQQNLATPLVVEIAILEAPQTNTEEPDEIAISGKDIAAEVISDESYVPSDVHIVSTVDVKNTEVYYRDSVDCDAGTSGLSQEIAPLYATALELEDISVSTEFADSELVELSQTVSADNSESLISKLASNIARSDLTDNLATDVELNQTASLVEQDAYDVIDTDYLMQLTSINTSTRRQTTPNSSEGISNKVNFDAEQSTNFWLEGELLVSSKKIVKVLKDVPFSSTLALVKYIMRGLVVKPA